MKLHKEYFTILMMIAVILLAGCSGCAQKQMQPQPVEIQEDETQTPIVEVTPSEIESLNLLKS